MGIEPGPLKSRVKNLAMGTIVVPFENSIGDIKLSVTLINVLTAICLELKKHFCFDD